MKIPVLVLMTVIFCSVVVNASGKEENTAETLVKGTYAVLLNGTAPVYPLKALQRGIEGWVIVGFLVKPDGTTDEIEILGSSIEDYFDDTAIEATRTRTYEPATASGKPVMQGNMSIRYTFAIKQSDGGVSKPFMRAYKKASQAIDNHDPELAKDLIDQLDGSEKRLLAEVCYLDMLKARYFDDKGDSKATLRHVERALVIADDVASKEIYINLLKQAIADNAKATNFRTSLKRYDTLKEVDSELSPDDPIHDFAERVRQILNSNKQIRSTGEVTRACKTCENPDGVFWGRTLNRSRFSIDQVLGKLDEVEIFCENSTVSVVYSPETVWTVNKDGGECAIRVYGEEGTTFQLVELAAQDQSS